MQHFTFVRARWLPASRPSYECAVAESRPLSGTSATRSLVRLAVTRSRLARRQTGATRSWLPLWEMVAKAAALASEVAR